MSLVDLGSVPRPAPRSTRAEFDAVLYGEKHGFAGAAALNELIDCMGVQRVVRVIADRHLKSGAVLTWSLLRESKKRRCDISLLGRWPVEALMEFLDRSQIPPNEGLTKWPVTS
jgi:hypothetical protein